MEEKKKTKVRLIGDGTISPESVFAMFRWIENDEERVYLADYTESGLYLQMRLPISLKTGGVPFQFEDSVPLMQALEKLPEDAELSAEPFTYYKKYLSDKNIKTVKDLKKALAEE